jgi:hypothetical protein
MAPPAVVTMIVFLEIHNLSPMFKKGGVNCIQIGSADQNIYGGLQTAERKEA